MKCLNSIWNALFRRLRKPLEGNKSCDNDRKLTKLAIFKPPYLYKKRSYLTRKIEFELMKAILFRRGKKFTKNTKLKVRKMTE